MGEINVIDYKDRLSDKDEVKKIIMKKYNSPLKKFFGTAKEVRAVEVKETYKPYWFIDILGLAARPPFQPKKIRYTMFVDGVTGFSGLTYLFPPFISLIKNEEDLEELLIDKDKLNQIIQKTEESHIRKKYFLKGPELIIQKKELIYLPYARVKSFIGDAQKILYVNRISGEID